MTLCPNPDSRLPAAPSLTSLSPRRPPASHLFESDNGHALLEPPLFARLLQVIVDLAAAEDDPLNALRRLTRRARVGKHTERAGTERGAGLAH